MDESPRETIAILVVEDDSAVAELLCLVISDVDGWGVTAVHDAAQAREVLRQVKINALVLDINLPGISGLELLMLLRDDAGWYDPPVILVSAHGEQPGIQEAVARGEATQFLAKPFDIDDVIRAIRAAFPS